MVITACLMLSSITLISPITVAQANERAIRPNVRTDRGIYSPPESPELPGAGGVFKNPMLDTEIMCVTDETDGRENCNAYSYWPSFNKDSPRANISRDGRFIVFTSNWQGKGQRDVFILKVPSIEDSSPSGTN